MTQRFDDMARERDALYQAEQPSLAFADAVFHDRYAGELDRFGADIAADKERAWRDAVLLRLAIRGLTLHQEVKP